MIEQELENSKQTIQAVNHDKIRDIESWFRHEYVQRLLTIQRHTYLGIDVGESRYTLELEAYNKENELRRLKGLEPLPAMKVGNIL